MIRGANASARTPLPEIAGYRIVRVLGEGGMSTVYLGTQLSLGREVAIKLMRPEALADEVSRRRFENEARTIARLEHPHIVGIHEVGRTADGLPRVIHDTAGDDRFLLQVDAGGQRQSLLGCRAHINFPTRSGLPPGSRIPSNYRRSS